MHLVEPQIKGSIVCGSTSFSNLNYLQYFETSTLRLDLY